LKRYEIGCQLVLITNRKSHTGFRLVPTVTLNNLERPLFCVISPNWIALEADYLTMVEDRHVTSIQNILFRFRPKVIHAAVTRSLCDSWGTCIYSSRCIFHITSMILPTECVLLASCCLLINMIHMRWYVF